MDLLDSVCTLLEDTWGARPNLGEPHLLRGSNRSAITRIPVLSGPDHAPSSVVVKQPAQPDGFDPDGDNAWGLYNDWAGLVHLNAHTESGTLCPRFIAAERGLGLLIMEDLGEITQLDHLLLGDDPAIAESALTSLMRTLGKMHAATLGKRAEFDRLRDGLGKRLDLGDAQSRLDQLRNTLETMAAAADLKPERGIEREFRSLLDTVNPDNPFNTYCHVDPCPDNCLLVEGEVKLIDFEWGVYRHALMDGVYGRIHFPTCWCVNRIPDSIVNRMDEVHREELGRTCRAALDDALYHRGVAEAAIWQVLGWTQTRALEQDSDWGIATLRQRIILRFDLLARTLSETNEYPAIGSTIDRTADVLRQRWLEVEPMPLYPALRATGE